MSQGSLIWLLPMPVRAMPLGGGEQLAGVQDDDRALGPGDDPGDVGGRQAAHHRPGRRDGRAVDPHHLAHLVHQHADALVVEIEHHEPGLLADRRVELEAASAGRPPAPRRPRRGPRPRGNPGALGSGAGVSYRRMRSTWRMSNANSWVPDPEGHELDVVASGGHADSSLREARAQRGEVEQRHEPAIGAGDRRRPRQRAARRAPASPGVVQHRLGLLHLEAESAAAELDQHAGVGPRSGQDAHPSSSAPRWTSGRIRPRTIGDPAHGGLAATAPGRPSRGRAPRRPGPAAGRPAGRRRAPAGAPACTAALIGPPSGRAPRPTAIGDPADRQDVIDAAGLHRRARHAVDRRGLAVLRDPDAAGVVDLAQPVGAVAAESGQHHADGARPEDLRRRSGTSGSAAGRTPQIEGSWSSSSAEPIGPAATRI